MAQAAGVRDHIVWHSEWGIVSVILTHVNDEDEAS